MALTTPLFYPKPAKELVKAAGRGWYDTFQHYLPWVQQHPNAQEYCTHALFAVLKGIGDPKRGRVLSLRSQNDGDFEQCIFTLLPLSDCASVLHSPQLLRVAHKYAAQGSRHYSLFVARVRRIFEDSNMAVPGAWNDVFRQYDNTQALIAASAVGDAVEVKRLIPLAVAPADGNRALCKAAENGHPRCVQLLCAVSIFEAVAAHNNPCSPLEWAAKNGHVECVRALLKHSHPSTHFPSAAFSARHGHLDVVEILAPALKSKHAGDILTAAAVGGHTTIAKLLERTFSQQDLKQGEALKNAAASGHVDMVRHFVEYASSQQIARALNNAACYGQPACVKVLLSHSSCDDNRLALEELAQLPARRWDPANRTTLTPPQKMSLELLAEHCDAQAVLTALQTAHPQDPQFWEELEELLLPARQRSVLSDSIEDKKRAMARRKM